MKNVKSNNFNKNLIATELEWGKTLLTNQDETTKRFDYIVCTDVIFCEPLVVPLIESMKAHSHEKTIVYLLVQIRDEAAHNKFFQKIGDYYEGVDKLSIQCGNETLEKCSSELDCLLFRFTKPRGKKRLVL